MKMFMYKFFTPVFAILLLALASPAQAQSKKELAAQNAQLAERIKVLESRLLTGDPAAARLLARMDGLEAAQRNLTGEIERLRYERDNLQSEVEALTGDIRSFQELSTRMKIHLDAVDLVAREQQERAAPITYGGSDGFDNLDTTQPSAIPGPPVVTQQPLIIDGQQMGGTEPMTLPPASVKNEASKLGEIGIQKLYEGDFVGAQTALSQYLEFNPEAEDAGEMRYWLGESYYVRGGFADAADAYISSMRQDPKGVKAPDAMVRLAATLRQLGNKAEACQTLSSFPRQYPNADETVKEKARVEAARTGC
ncbi:tol-pal system protein YbgF [Litorimonas taeanensis]|uniref:Cell division coordinator CpoB n=2 Tax=Litorimonas taeanensis TaxID=568099 RepID=A0A420WLK4_9PROT|nr:tol-pal system protein YbgF [Litorimonas taeanensis]